MFFVCSKRTSKRVPMVATCVMREQNCKLVHSSTPPLRYYMCGGFKTCALVLRRGGRVRYRQGRLRFYVEMHKYGERWQNMWSRLSIWVDQDRVDDLYRFVVVYICNKLGGLIRLTMSKTCASWVLPPPRIPSCMISSAHGISLIDNCL